MTRSRLLTLFTGFALLCSSAVVCCADASASSPDFKELYDLLRQHLAGVNESQLNQTAVQALVSALSPRVALLTNGPPTEPKLVTRASLFRKSLGYIRVGRVHAGLDDALRAACQQLAATNRLQGVVLDLRYADGHDYPAAAAAASVFLSNERPLMDWGQGMEHSKTNPGAFTMPVAVLVNHETAGAAEALAAVLRETGAGLILGSPTAGAAMVTQEFGLSNGEKLRIATAPVRLADAAEMPAGGVKPDILVEVNPSDELAYFANPTTSPRSTNLDAGTGLPGASAAGGTNRLSRRVRFNEAELVRERRDGVSLAEDIAAGATEAGVEEPVVRDPALARGLDILEGLAVVRHHR